MSPSARRPAWVGIDVGTQSLRAALVDVDGRLLGSGTAPLRSRRPHPGHHEQDPDDWWVALGRATRDALAGAHDNRPVVGALAICSTSGTVLLTDDSGQVRSRALMYDDARAGDQAGRVAAAETQLASRHAGRAHPSSAVPRLLWLLEHDDDTPGGGCSDRRLTHCADLLAGRLVGGPVATDETHALKSGYDPERGCWRTELFDLIGVPPSVLTPVVAPGAPLGVLSRPAAHHTGLPAGTPVLAGMTDSCAAQIAAGALAPGNWSSVLGTTLALKGVTAEPIVDLEAGVYSHRHPDRDAWLVGGASNVGAGALTRCFAGRDLLRLDAAAASHEPAPAVLYPLGEPGERFPFARPDATPIQLGELGADAQHYAGLLQGVGFVERLCLARMRALGAGVIGPLRLTGGGARSDYWCQLRADISGLSVCRPAHPEPAVGMAILASAGPAGGGGRSRAGGGGGGGDIVRDGGGRRPVAQATRRMVHSDLELEPRVDRAGRFEESYRRLCDELAVRGYLAGEWVERHALQPLA